MVPSNKYDIHGVNNKTGFNLLNIIRRPTKVDRKTIFINLPS